MKFVTKLAAAAAVAAATISAPAVAEDKGTYVLGSIGVSQTDFDAVSADESFSFEIGLGYDFGNDIRAELTWDKNYLSSITVLGTAFGSDVSNDAVLASIYKDFSNESKITPFIGVSLGSANPNGTGTAALSSAFAYGVSVGASYETSEKTDLYAKVQTLYASPEAAGVSFDSNIISAKVGVRYSF